MILASINYDPGKKPIENEYYITLTIAKQVTKVKNSHVNKKGACS